MFDVCVEAGRTPPCDCNKDEASELHVIDDCCTRQNPQLMRSEPTSDLDAYSFELEKPGTRIFQDKFEERALVRKIAQGESTAESDATVSSSQITGWFFYVTNNPDARWVKLDDMYNEGHEKDERFLVIRDCDVCVECVLGCSLGEGLKTPLVLPWDSVLEGLMSHTELIDPLFSCDVGNTVALTDDDEFTDFLPREHPLAKLTVALNGLDIDALSSGSPLIHRSSS